MARGYVGRPDLTKKRFVQRDPVGAGPVRMYRTGDRCVERQDGVIEFLGRIDRQVKLHGHRIEPGEVEAILLLHPAVRECVVGVHGREARAELAAWVVPHANRKVDPGVLRAHVQSHLPPSMVPAAYVALASLPLNTRGKVDRQALPPPDRAAYVGLAPRSDVVPARNEVERACIRLFEEALPGRCVGLEDNLFSLGEHSLDAVKILARVEETLGIPVSLGSFWLLPTPRALAAAIGSPSPQMPTSSSGARSDALSEPEKALWYLEQLEVGSAPNTRHCLFVRVADCPPSDCRRPWLPSRAATMACVRHSRRDRGRPWRLVVEPDTCRPVLRTISVPADEDVANALERTITHELATPVQPGRAGAAPRASRRAWRAAVGATPGPAPPRLRRLVTAAPHNRSGGGIPRSHVVGRRRSPMAAPSASWEPSDLAYWRRLHRGSTPDLGASSSGRLIRPVGAHA